MTDLDHAAQSLETRLALLEVPRSKLPLEVWKPLERAYPGLVPDWYKELLANYAFMDAYLDVSRWDGESYGANFNFWPPLEDDWEYTELPEVAPKGWFVFAEEADGNYWAMRAGADQDSPIILIEHTSGGLDCENGYYYAAHSLAHLLATASISAARKEHLLPTGFVDVSKSGIGLWGYQDSFLIRHGIDDAKKSLGINKASHPTTDST